MRAIFCIAYTLFVLFMLVPAANAQQKLRVTGSTTPLLFSAMASTGHSGTGANIDVRYHRVQWTINPDDATKTISGTVTTYFKTTQDSVTKITFDLSSTHSFSATYHGSAIATARPSTNVIELTLPAALAINTLDSVTVSYSGTPPPFSNYGEGYDRKNFTSTGNVTYTLAESYGDDDFWPCKADMQDKVDSAMDFIITIPSAFMAATNGMLVSNVVSGTNRVLTYKHTYPIASYLVCVAVGRYNVFNRGTVNIGGTNMPVQYYIYTGRGSNPTTQLNAMDFCKQELTAFSAKFGDYPFKNEKYGMYEFGWGGGMEHQTFSALNFSSMSSWSVIAHELTHQWFGDKVTFATWNHLWLAEGFAQYGEILAAELISGLGQNAASYRSGIKSTALSTSTTPVYLSDASIQNSNTLWTTANDNAIYKRGAMVVSMLRKLSGDALFFQALKEYLADSTLAYKSATTDDLKNHFEAVLGYDLDPFFNDYIYGTGNPAYTIKWNNSGTKVAVKIAGQTRSAGSTVPYFHAPVVLKFSNGVSSASVVMYDQNGSLSYAGNGIAAPSGTTTLTYTLPFTPTTVTFDANAETLASGTVTKDATINPLVNAVQTQNFTAVHTASGNALTLLVDKAYDKTSVIAERSDDGIVFSVIGRMAKEVFSTGAVHTLEDKTFSNAHAIYYRIKTTDAVGVVEYSKTIHLKNAAAFADGVSVRPTVVSSDLRIVLSKGWEKIPASFTLFNSAGVAVKKERQNATSSVQLQVRDLPAGLYTVEVQQVDGNKITKPFVVVR